MSQADKSAVPKAKYQSHGIADGIVDFGRSCGQFEQFQFALTETLTRWDASWGADARVPFCWNPAALPFSESPTRDVLYSGTPKAYRLCCSVGDTHVFYSHGKPGLDSDLLLTRLLR